jgi:dGTP triphosphohydrolase
MPVPAIKNLIYKINDYEDIENELQNIHFGEFKDISKFIKDTDTDDNIFDILKEISEIKDKLVLDIPDVVKWDIKGVYLCLELAQKMYDAINYERNINSSKSPEIEEYLKIFSKKYRGHLKKSYEAGKMFYEKIDELIDDIEDEEFKNLLKDYKRLVKNNDNPADEKNNDNPADDMGIKFVVWDWMAGMTDSYIIKEYESMTFKRLDLR